MMTDHELRREIAGKYLRGRGFEVGAGLSPTFCDAIDEILFIDKRDTSEFEQLFGQPAPYQMLTLDQARAGYPDGADFVMAHHVLEHCSNPIKVLATEWLPLLRCGGVLFLSIPSSKIPSETGRIVTPIDHILDDWAFDRGDDAFESIDHITSFIVGWTRAFPDNFPYARGTVQEYTTGILSEINRLGHDLHWHTYSLAAAADLTEVAFHAAGAGLEWLYRQETEICVYLVARKLARAPSTPEPAVLKKYRQRLSETHLRLGGEDAANTRRSLPFKSRTGSRYWWFNTRVLDYVPTLFAVLTDSEWDILDQWYSETDARQSAYEANVPALSFLTSMIDGNGISNIVQLGHHEGFSTLLLGFTMRRMGFKHSVFTVDIDPACSRVCEHWVRKAGLSDYVSINVTSSDTPGLPEAARDYFGAEIETVFIDSSHQYKHTIDELELWFPALKPFGFIFLHDASTSAADFDASGSGGVMGAVKEWSRRNHASHILLNEDVVHGEAAQDIVYQDGCGLGIIQKRHPGRSGIPTVPARDLEFEGLTPGTNDADAVASSLEFARDRAAAVKARIPLSSGRGLEISPGAAPLVPKSDGNIFYCDKFSSPSSDGRDPVPIDLVLGPRLIHEALPQQSFDYIVSSHVIEHVPDFIQFLKSASLLLRPDGALVSLLPDRRFTFDALRDVSSIEEIEEAHRQQLRHPCRRMIEDVYLKSDFNITETSAIDLWNQTYQPQPYYSCEQALKLISEINPKEADIHCWTFTPQSCRALLEHVIEQHVPNMRIAEIIDTPRPGNEFLIHLTFGEHSKSVRQSGERRLVGKWLRKFLS